MAFALTASRNVFAWGSGKHGKLGVGDCRDAFVPRLVIELSTKGDSGVVKIVAGAHHAHALTAGGSLYSWGLNSCGQLGLGSDIQSKNIPTIVKEFRYWNGAIRDVFTSSKFSLAIVNIPKKIESKTFAESLKDISFAKKLVKYRRLFAIRVTKYETPQEKARLWKLFKRKLKSSYPSLKGISEFSVALRSYLKQQMDPDLSTKEAIVDDYPKDSEDAEMTKEPFVNVPALDVSDPAFNASYRAYLQVYKTLTSSLVTKMCLSDRYTKIDDAQKSLYSIQLNPF